MPAPRLEDIQKRLLDMGIDGTGMYIFDRGARVVPVKVYQIRKALKGYDKGVLKVGISLVDYIMPKLRETPYIGDWLGLVGRDGVKDILRTALEKPAVVIADDANTLHAYNFNSTTIKLFIDGQEIADTDYTVQGDPNDFTISLKNPLSGGEHTVIVTDGTKAFEGKVKV